MKTISIQVSEIEYLTIKKECQRQGYKLSNFYKKILFMGLEQLRRTQNENYKHD